MVAPKWPIPSKCWQSRPAEVDQNGRSCPNSTEFNPDLVVAPSLAECNPLGFAAQELSAGSRHLWPKTTGLAEFNRTPASIRAELDEHGEDVAVKTKLVHLAQGCEGEADL